jgi:hypothetical protein
MDETSFPGIVRIEIAEFRRLVPCRRRAFYKNTRIGRLDPVQPGARLLRQFDKDKYTRFPIDRLPAQNREAAEDLRMRRRLRIAQEFRA